VGLVLLAFTLVVAAGFALKFAAPGYIQKYVADKTGFPVSAETFEIHPLGGRVAIENLEILNPAEFGGESFIDVPEFGAQVDLSSFFGKTYHIRELTLHIDSLTIVRNAKGQMNTQVFVDRLNGVASQTTSQVPLTQTQTAAQPIQPAQLPQQSSQQKSFSAAHPILIDHMKLQIDSVRIVNLATKKTSNVNLNFNFEQTNVTDFGALRRQIVVTALAQGLRQGLGGGINDVTQTLLGGTQETLNLTGQAAQKVEKTINAIKDLKHIFKAKTEEQ